MKATMVRVLLGAALVVGGLQSARPLAAEPTEQEKKAVSLSTSEKIEEAEAKGNLGEPRFGYVGELGSFAAVSKNNTEHEAMAAFVVHHYPHQEKLALGCTKLRYQGPRRLANVDGWVFLTDWDGKANPSKVFLSAERVYFGGGVQAYIAADYREGTGWAWKMLPLRRLELTGKNETGSR
jgi:hypothetical protein